MGEEEKEKCNRWGKGVLLFAEENVIKIGKGEKNNITNIRKMLQTCSVRDGEGCFLLAEKIEGSYPLFGIMTEDAFQTLSGLNGNFWLVEFTGLGGWKLSRGDDLALLYQRGEFLIDPSQEAIDIANMVAKIKSVKGDKTEVFKKILSRLKEQGHGALLIISNDADNEARILCNKFRRGILIKEIDFSEESNLPLLDGIAAVDGAVLMDFSGICYGFGVILDGDAKTEGDMSKGARYNSALNYIAGKDRYAVVVSEDKENGIRILSEKDIILKDRD